MWANFFSCYLWWLLAGVLLGWLANYLLCKCCCKGCCKTCCTKECAPVKEPLHQTLASTAPTTIATVLTPIVPLTSAPSPVVIDIAAAKAAGIKVKGADDLEIIEGIGPKICGLFHAADHVTFAQVAQLSVAQMSHILNEAGPRYKLANPETWAQQADLAANNRWAELKTLQDALSGGMTVPQARDKV